MVYFYINFISIKERYNIGLCNILTEMERGRGRWVTGSRDIAATPPPSAQKTGAHARPFPHAVRRFPQESRGWRFRVLALRLEDQSTVRQSRLPQSLHQQGPQFPQHDNQGKGGKGTGFLAYSNDIHISTYCLI